MIYLKDLKKKKFFNKGENKKTIKYLSDELSMPSQSKLVNCDLENYKSQKIDNIMKKRNSFDETNNLKPGTLCPKLQRGISFDEALRDHRSKKTNCLSDVNIFSFDKPENEGDNNSKCKGNPNIIIKQVNCQNQNVKVDAKEYLEEREIDSGEIKLVKKKKKRKKMKIKDKN